MPNGRTPSWFHWQNDALVLTLAVQPGAARSGFAGLHGTALKIRIQSPPVDGKANRALIEFLAEEFCTPKSRVILQRGDSSRSKSIRIERPVSLPATLQTLGLTANSR